MATQRIKWKAVMIGGILLFILSIVLLASASISRITEALRTPPLSDEQITVLAQEIAREHKMLLLQRQSEIQEACLEQVACLESQLFELSRKIEQTDSIVHYVRTTEISRISIQQLPMITTDNLRGNQWEGISIQQSPMITTVDAAVDAIIQRNQTIKKQQTWQDTVRKLQKRLN